MALIRSPELCNVISNANKRAIMVLYRSSKKVFYGPNLIALKSDGEGHPKTMMIFDCKRSHSGHGHMFINQCKGHVTNK